MSALIWIVPTAVVTGLGTLTHAQADARTQKGMHRLGLSDSDTRLRHIAMMIHSIKESISLMNDRTFLPAFPLLSADSTHSCSSTSCDNSHHNAHR
jgi:hypothetical protein